MRSLRTWLAAVALLLPLAAAAQLRLAPIDDAASSTDFVRFREELRSVVLRRDATVLRSLLHPQVKLSFDEDDGPGSFDRLWDAASPSSKVWETLSSILALGGTFDSEGAFTAPYVFSRWPTDVDPFEHAAVTASAVNVRAAPSLSSPVVGQLDFAIVATPEGMDEIPGWVRIRTPSGLQGYVASRFVRSPIDYRLKITQHEGRWTIVLLLAGC